MPYIFCPSCGDRIAPEHRFCPSCGAETAPSADGMPRRGRRRECRTWGREWRTRASIFGLPLIHVAYGRNEFGRLRVAKGVFAIGQFAVGLVTIAQFGVGVLFGFGQFMLGYVAVAQFAGTGLFGLGQFAAGQTAVGQFALGVHALGQMAFGAHVWDTTTRDPEAVQHFTELWQQIQAFFGG